MNLSFKRNLANWDRVLRLILASFLFVLPTMLTLNTTWIAIFYIIAAFNVIEAAIGY